MDDRRHSDSNSIDSELIGIVYEVAFDPHFWPDLLEGISQLFNDRRANNLSATTPPDNDSEPHQLFPNQLEMGEAQRLATLLPHVYRALKLKREYNDTNHSRGQAQAIIEQFPFGVLLVNAQGKLISTNQHSLDIIADNNSLCLKNDVLCITSAKQDHQLKNLIERAANTTLAAADEHVSPFRIDGKNENAPLSLLITPDPYPNPTYDRLAENCAAIFISSASISQQISVTALQTLFSLSRAEAQLASLLVSGVNLSQAAEQSCIAKNTAKVQLKAIFSKLGVNRQAELIKRILSSPAVIQPANGVPDDAWQKVTTNLQAQANKEKSLQLSDGRHLQYAEFGDPHGRPVIHIHGIIGCRYERLPDDGLTRDLGVRLIIPDRPGYGLSERAPGHGYLDFADDLLELVDRLELPQCSIMGLSVGAIYGAAFAYKAPQRLHRLAMISSTPPFRSFADFVDMPASLKLLIAFSKYLPSAARKITEMAINNACKDPDKFLASIPVCAADRRIFSHPVLLNHIKWSLLAGNQYYQSGFVEEILLSAQPWPFPIEDVQTNIDFWHGTADTHSPISRVQPVVDAVPNSHFHKINGGGHFLIYDHWQEILESLAH